MNFELFNSVEVSERKSKKYCKIFEVDYIHEYMDIKNHESNIWEELSYEHSNHKFCGGFSTYMGKCVTNLTKQKKIVE